MPGIPHNLIRFEEPNTILFCRTCKTHLALEEHIIGMSDFDGPDAYVRINQMVNTVLSDSYIAQGNQVIAQLSCKLCSVLLGYKTVNGPGHNVADEFIVSSTLSLLLDGHEVMCARTRAVIFGDWRLSVIRLPIPLDGNFYQCRRCGTHLALEHNLIERTPQSLVFQGQGVFNIHLGENLFPDDHTRANNVHCADCYRKLGVKNVSPQGQRTTLDLNTVLLTDAEELSRHLSSLPIML